MRIIEGFSTEGSPNHTMFGLTMAEGAAILGEAKVEGDGSWLAKLPPYVPMHLQPIDEFDMSIRSQDHSGSAKGMPGENRVCGGCHEDRNAPNLPNAGTGPLTIAAGRGPENFMLPIDSRTEYPWAKANDAANPNEIQALLNTRCVSCHNGTTNGDKAQEFYTVSMSNAVLGTNTDYKIARMDLSTDTPVTVYYDRKVATWPSSYVSLFYPAAMDMNMAKGAKVTSGTIPPKWAIPSDARNSLLIEKLNISSRRRRRQDLRLGRSGKAVRRVATARREFLAPGPRSGRRTSTRDERVKP